MYLDPSKVIPLESLVGQESAKNAAWVRVQATATGAPLASFSLLDCPGMGKTAIAKAMVAEMQKATAHLPKSQQVQGIYINLKGTHNKTDGLAADFFEALEKTLLSGGPRLVIILDEFATAEAGGSFQAELAAILSKIGGESRGGEHIPLYGREAGSAIFQPERLAFIICSWNPKKAAADLRTRFPQPKEFQLAPYTPAELEQILDMQCGLFEETHTKNAAGDIIGIHFTQYALATIARSLRGNAREVEAVLKNAAAKSMAAHYRGERYSVTRNTVGELMRDVGVYPQGLNSLEVKILSVLSTAKQGLNLRELEARTGEANKMLTNAVQYLQYQLCGPTGTPGEPFTLYDESGEILKYADGPQAGKEMKGALLFVKGAKYFLSYHGTMMLSILKHNKFINA